MKKSYKKPTFNKTSYISVDNIADGLDDSSPISGNWGGLMQPGGGSPCNCVECLYEGLCHTECSICE